MFQPFLNRDVLLSILLLFYVFPLFIILAVLVFRAPKHLSSIWFVGGLILILLVVQFLIFFSFLGVRWYFIDQLIYPGRAIRISDSFRQNIAYLGEYDW